MKSLINRILNFLQNTPKQGTKKNEISTPSQLTHKALLIWETYKSMPPNSLVEIQLVIQVHTHFNSLLSLTGPLKDQYEYDRRLMSRAHPNPKDSTKDRSKFTLEWLKNQSEFDAGRAADIAHNLYFSLKLQKYTSNAVSTFQDIEVNCDNILRQLNKAIC